MAPSRKSGRRILPKLFIHALLTYASTAPFLRTAEAALGPFTPHSMRCSGGMRIDATAFWWQLPP